MDWVNGVPESIWQLPLPILMLILIATGWLVTRREHANMTNMMEYFRTLCENKDKTISNQSAALEVYKDVSPLLKEVLEGVRKIAKEKRDDVSTKEEA